MPKQKDKTTMCQKAITWNHTANQSPGHAVEKRHDANRHGRPRELPHQPALGDVLHKVARTRNERAFQEKTKVSMSDCPKRSNFPKFSHAVPPPVEYQQSV